MITFFKKNNQIYFLKKCKNKFGFYHSTFGESYGFRGFSLPVFLLTARNH